MDNFKCDICGKTHSIYFSSRQNEPDILSEMTESERADRVWSYGSYHLIDKSFVLARRNLYIKINDLEDRYVHWEIWIKLPPRKLIKMIDDSKGKYSTIDGELYDPIVHYWNSSQGMQVQLEFYLSGKVELPMVKILDTPTELGKDYADGVTITKVIDWIKKNAPRRRLF